MGRRVLFSSCLLAGLAGCAAEPRYAGAVVEDPVDNAYCIRETGTRLALPEGACVNAPSKVYTQEDLLHTGAATLEDALNHLGE